MSVHMIIDVWRLCFDPYGFAMKIFFLTQTHASNIQRNILDQILEATLKGTDRGNVPMAYHVLEVVEINIFARNRYGIINNIFSATLLVFMQ